MEGPSLLSYYWLIVRTLDEKMQGKSSTNLTSWINRSWHPISHHIDPQIICASRSELAIVTCIGFSPLCQRQLWVPPPTRCFFGSVQYLENPNSFVNIYVQDMAVVQPDGHKRNCPKSGLLTKLPPPVNLIKNGETNVTPGPGPNLDFQSHNKLMWSCFKPCTQTRPVCKRALEWYGSR